MIRHVTRIILRTISLKLQTIDYKVMFVSNNNKKCLETYVYNFFECLYKNYIRNDV